MDEDKNKLKLWEKNPVGTKLILIGIMAMLLLIPTSMIEGLINERESRNIQVTNEIGSKWGREQTVTGPVVMIPYLDKTVNSEGRTIVNRRELYLLPALLEVTADVDPSTRYRGIYEAVVYSSNIRMQGNFDLGLIKKSRISEENILFNEAIILLGISDMKGVRKQISAHINGESLEVDPSFQGSVVNSSVGARLADLSSLKELVFDFEVDLNGNGQLRFVPVGKQTHVSMTSPWNSPSFNGSFLPTERDIDQDGFTASWNVLHFNRDFPQIWANRNIELEHYAFGVSFIIPADIYQQSTRTAKYAIMFIGLTFSAFFISEILICKRIHPVQYMLIGFALVLFYVLLVSISEHMSFPIAYLIASVATIAMIASYAVSMLKSLRMGTIVASILAGLYSYMYVLLNLEDYSLLLGAGGLCVVLSAIMYLTRKIDWYAGAAETD